MVPAGLKIRAAKQEDLPFVLQSSIREMSKTVFYDSFALTYTRSLEKTLQLILLCSTTEMFVACSAEDEDQIAGYLIADTENRVMYWSYVKAQLRGHGVFSALLEAALPGTEKKTVVFAPPDWPRRQYDQEWDRDELYFTRTIEIAVREMGE